MAVSKKELFEETYETYFMKLYHFCLVQLKNVHDAEDAVQEVFIKRLYNAPEFKSAQHEKYWIYRVATNICRDKLKQKRRTELALEFADHIGITQQEQELLKNVMEMPEKYRVVIHLHYYEGYGVKEISKLLGITESAVKMRLKRGREQLRKELEGDI